MPQGAAYSSLFPALIISKRALHIDQFLTYASK